MRERERDGKVRERSKESKRESEKNRRERREDEKCMIKGVRRDSTLSLLNAIHE